MNKSDAKKIFWEKRFALTGVNIETDDGCDEADAMQNLMFSVSIREIREIRNYVRDIDVDGIDMNDAWKRSLDVLADFNPNVPEDLYMQTVAYIDNVLSMIDEKS